jgi:hypothetical protein
MTRRGTTGIAWLIGLIAVLASTVGQPVAAHVFGSREAVAEPVEGAGDEQGSLPVLEPRAEKGPRG